MIESNRKHDSYGKQKPEHVFVTHIQNQQRKESYDQQRQLGCNNIRQNCSYKETFFTFEDGAARGTMMPNLKRALDN
jgi:hypothetical protein